MTDDPSNLRQSRRPLPAPSASPYQIPPPPRVPGTPPPPPKRDHSSTAPPPAVPRSVAPPAPVPAAVPSVSPLPSSPSFSPELSLAEQMEDLERWAVATQARIKTEVLRVTLLRVLTMACLLGALVTVPLGAVALSTALAAVALLGMMIEVAWPGLNSGRRMRREAVHALRDLQNTLKLDWDRVRLMHADAADPKRLELALGLLDTVRAQRELIARRLCDVEPSPPLGRTSL